MPVNKKKSRPRDWHHEERQAKISYLYIKPKQEVCQMDDKELIVCLSKKVARTGKEILTLRKKKACTSSTNIRSWKMSRNNDNCLFRAELEYL